MGQPLRAPPPHSQPAIPFTPRPPPFFWRAGVARSVPRVAAWRRQRRGHARGRVCAAAFRSVRRAARAAPAQGKRERGVVWFERRKKSCARAGPLMGSYAIFVSCGRPRAHRRTRPPTWCLARCPGSTAASRRAAAAPRPAYCRVAARDLWWWLGLRKTSARRASTTRGRPRSKGGPLRPGQRAGSTAPRRRAAGSTGTRAGAGKRVRALRHRKRSRGCSC